MLKNFFLKKYSSKEETFTVSFKNFFTRYFYNRLSKTFAELRTPGTPAPGWVPAPTKNKLFITSDLL